MSQEKSFSFLILNFTLETPQLRSLHHFGIVPGDICLFDNAEKKRTVE